VALADMPCVGAGTVSRVASALREGASIAAPFHGGKRGHPVGFARQWLDSLVTLGGDRGARDLLQAHGDAITRIDVDDPGCLFDVDTPDDLPGLMPLSRISNCPGSTLAANFSSHNPYEARGPGSRPEPNRITKAAKTET
jgi:molybdenum cofactor cytidylyltransferase